MQVAAIYARVSSDKQKEENTIASQTAALIAFAREQGYSVPDEWVFEDEGYSGATLVRPGLERVRDLAAEGQIQAILVHAPDRLSCKYAYQVLLTEEFARAGVEVLFVKAPRNATAEDQLLLQFQGMIAEYERAQILERSRRGKRHRAREGQVSVLSGAPFGYRYVRKTDQMAAYYAVIEAEAQIVRSVFERYTAQGLSIGAIACLLNEERVATRKQTGRWERSVIWAMLRNPAYKGTACFGKTQKAPRQRITRPLRLRGGFATRDSGQHERSRADWIEIPVPPSSARQPLRLPRSGFKPTRNMPRAAPSHRVSCKASCLAASVGTRSIAPRRTQARARSTIIVAWDRIATGISVDRFVTIIRSAKTCLIRSCGTRLSSSSRIQASSRRSLIVA